MLQKCTAVVGAALHGEQLFYVDDERMQQQCVTVAGACSQDFSMSPVCCTAAAVSGKMLKVHCSAAVKVTQSQLFISPHSAQWTVWMCW